MAQLVVRNLPDEVKSRLKRRAECHGRSLEAEVRDILEQVPESTPPDPEKSRLAVAHLVKRLEEIGVTNEDVESLGAEIAELRRDQRLRHPGGDQR